MSKLGYDKIKLPIVPLEIAENFLNPLEIEIYKLLLQQKKGGSSEE